jgi:endo-1,4-beta-xylanase
MKHSRSELVLACLLMTLPIASYAQTEPVIVEAESAALGASLSTGTSGTTTYVFGSENRTTAPSVPFIATHSITFPASGNWELYARILVGPNGANDDSFYFGNGFGTPVPETGNWALQNEANTGFTNAAASVLVGGTAGSNVFKWIKITGAQGPNPWVVPAGALTQTFQWGSREDGLQLDKFAFGRPGVCYTVANLDNGQAASGTCPPPPPPEPPPYTRTAPPIATGFSDKYLGGAWSPNNASIQFANYWNQVTPENGGKWGSVEGTRDVYNWAQADAAYALAKANGWPFKWHTLIWGNQQPAWIESLPTAEQRIEIEEWYAEIAARYPDIDQIEVVNEPLHDAPRGATNGNYIEALGGNGTTGWDWVITSFQLARQYFPDAELLINDYSITNDGNATTNYLTIINLLKERGLIDAIGDQGHAFSTTEQAPMNNHRNNLNRLAATGLPIYITELDIDGVSQGVLNHEVQLAAYQRIFPVFWEHPSVKGVTIWGYVQNNHWRNAQGAWLKYLNGGERPALQWLIRYVQNAPAEVRPQILNVDESVAAGAALGNVVANDVDADSVFSQWQINSDPSGKFVIDAATGMVSLAAGASLDFESFTSHAISVSVWDGYRRSAPGTVTIQVANANDNAPAVTASSFNIDDGSRYVLGTLAATDPDDVNQPGFTAFSGWAVTGGTGASVFAVNAASGEFTIKRPLLIDFNKSSYSVLVTVTDGQNVSAERQIDIAIPRKVTICLLGLLQLDVPKQSVPLLLRNGAALGACKRWW